MKRLLILAYAFAAVYFFQVDDLSAQASRLRGVTERKRPASGSASTKVISIQKITGVGNRAKIETPIYSTTAPRGVTSGKLWARIEVLYDTARSEDQWLDELTLTYYALAKKTDKEKGLQYTFYSKNVRYVDIRLDRKPLSHRGTVFLRPNSILRNGPLVAVAVEVSYKGKVIDMAADLAPNTKLPKSEKGIWWKNPVITESKITKSDNSSLLDRSQSPWAYINMDDFEVIK